MRWFRFYDDVVNDPKIQRLPLPLLKFWVNALCLASKHDGKLPSVADMTFTLRIGAEKVRELIQGLSKAGLLDEYEGGWSPHNWRERQYESDSSTDRVKRFRKRQRNVSCNVGGNENGNVIEQSRADSDTEQSRAEQTPRTENGKDKPVSEEARKIAAEVASLLDGDAESPSWDAAYVDVWLIEGATEDQILAAAHKVRERGTVVSSIKYLEAVLKGDDPKPDKTKSYVPTGGPPKGMRDAKSTSEYVAYMREKLKDPKLKIGDWRLSRWQYVPTNWGERVIGGGGT